MKPNKRYNFEIDNYIEDQTVDNNDVQWFTKKINSRIKTHRYLNMSEITYMLNGVGQSCNLNLNLIAELYNLLKQVEKIKNKKIEILDDKIKDCIMFQYYYSNKVWRVEEQHIDFYNLVHNIYYSEEIRGLKAIWFASVFYNFIDKEYWHKQLNEVMLDLIDQQDKRTISQVTATLQVTECKEFLEELKKYEFLVEML